MEEPGFIDFLKMLYTKDGTTGNMVLMWLFCGIVFLPIKWVVEKKLKLTDGHLSYFIAGLLAFALFHFLVVVPFGLLE